MARAASCQSVGIPQLSVVEKPRKALALRLYVFPVSVSSDFSGDEARLSSILRVDHPFSLSLWVFILKTGLGGSERLRAL